MEAKICRKCETPDTGSNFYSKQNICKACEKLDKKLYHRTKLGLVTTIYSNQKKKSKKRGHPLPTYSKTELKEWLFSQEHFHVLYDNWKRLDFQSVYVPSVDRKDDYIGYTIGNIQLMSWGSNNTKGHSDRKTGKNNKANKTVYQLDKDKNLINTFHSISEAFRATGVSRAGIHSVLSGECKYAHGFIWSRVCPVA